MTHTAAVRASILFALLMIVLGAVGIGSRAVVAEAMFMISASVFAFMLLFAIATPAHGTVPARIRRTRSRF